jgi:proline iminopeptidase
METIMSRFRSALSSCLIALAAVASAASAETPNEIMRGARHLATKDAIDEQKLVEIGGIPQWISVRARHRGSPILLFVHGGPGFTVSPVSYFYLRDLEEYFTVVQWDQRGAGKTYAASDPTKVRPTMSIDRLVADGGELLQYLTRTYGQKRVVLLGHSFGTLLGVEMAQRYPELLYAYVGTGQFTDFQRSEAMGYQATLADAEAAHNEQAVRELRALAPFPDRLHPERNLQNLGAERRWLAEYGGYYWPTGVGHNGAIASLSPDYSAKELKVRDEAQGFSDSALWTEVGRINLMDRTRFRVPVLILQGRHDRGTSSALVAEWFARVRAPAKQLIWFEDSAHMTFEEEPGKFLVTLVNEALPLTHRK